MKQFWKLICLIILNISFFVLLVGAGPTIETLPKIGTVSIKLIVRQLHRSYWEESFNFDFDATHRMPIAEPLGGIHPPGPNQRLEVRVWNDDLKNPQLLFLGIIRDIDINAYEDAKLTVTRTLADEGNVITWELSFWKEAANSGISGKFFERSFTIKAPVEIFSGSNLPVKLESIYTEKEKNVESQQRDVIVNLLINPNGNDYDALGQAKKTIFFQGQSTILPVEMFGVPLKTQEKFQADKPLLWGFDVVNKGDVYDPARGDYSTPPIISGQIRGLTINQGHPKANLYLTDSATKPAQVSCNNLGKCTIDFQYDAVEEGIVRVDYFGPSDDPSNEFKNWQAWDSFSLPASPTATADFSQTTTKIHPENNQGFFIVRLYPKYTGFNNRGEALNRNQFIDHWVQGFIRKIIVED